VGANSSGEGSATEEFAGKERSSVIAPGGAHGNEQDRVGKGNTRRHQLSPDIHKRDEIAEKAKKDNPRKTESDPLEAVTGEQVCAEDKKISDRVSDPESESDAPGENHLRIMSHINEVENEQGAEKV